MGWIVWTICVFILVPVALFIGGAIKSASERNVATNKDWENGQWVARGVGFGLPAFFLFVWFITTIFAVVHQVPAGHVGVVYEFGSIVAQTDDGLQIVPPWRTIKTATVQVQTLCFVDEGDKCPDGARHVGAGLDSFSQETQDVFIDAVLNIEVSPTEVQSLYRNVGPDYVNKLIPGRIAQIFKDETVNYRAVDLAPSRELIRANVETQLRIELAPFSIDVTALLVENLVFDQAFTDSITRKQVAQQDALAEEERIKGVEAQAQQAIAAAGGRAESIRIEAEGQAAANTALAASLTPQLIQFQAMQKLADNIEIALIPSGQGIIIDPATILGGEE